VASESDSERPVAVIVVDMLNSYEHRDADALTESVEAVVEPISRLVDRCRGSEASLIYVNDNYGDWNSSAEELGERAMAGRRPDLVKPLLPPAEASFVIKARHSIFYGTPLEHLLSTVGASRLVLTGQVTEQCILYSALDAYVRGLDVVVPRDGVAHIDPRLADAAVEMMRRNMSARITDCSSCELG
jgi:nicotinamidase-related amidase